VEECKPLGLGINDYFVLASYVSHATAHAAPGGGGGWLPRCLPAVHACTRVASSSPLAWLLVP